MKLPEVDKELLMGIEGANEVTGEGCLEKTLACATISVSCFKRARKVFDKEIYFQDYAVIGNRA
jgi:hypothetical protein